MTERWLRVDLRSQTLELVEGERVARRYPVSTALRGAGEHAGSEQTPRGEHEVRELIGAGSPVGSVFMARVPTGEVCTPSLQAAHPERDWILSRVIWLGGCEPGRNCGEGVDTYARYIYIHGTPDEQPMGEPRSHGCIRMRNGDVIELFDLLAVGTRVRIDE